MIRNFVCIAAVSLMCINSFAQELCVTYSDTLLLIIQQKDSLLSIAYSNAQKDSAKIQTLTDSLVNVNNALNKKSIEYETLLEDLDFADLCMMSLAYRRCNEPFNKDNVSKAIGYFQRLHKQETKDKYLALKATLQDYEKCNSEIHSILVNAQNDSDRANNPFADDIYKKKYIDKLHSSIYYTHYMGRKVEYHLEYLEDIVNKALSRLEKHTGSQPADFSDLL